MDIQQRSQEIRAKVEEELAAAADDEARLEILVQALYRASDQVLREMGTPSRREKYLKGQEAALELLIFLCHPLVRFPHRGRDLVSVLAEVGEASHDPVVQNKLAGYRRQILLNSGEQKKESPSSGARWYPAGAAFSLVLVVMLLVSLVPRQRTVVLKREGAPAATSAPPAALPPPVAVSSGPRDAAVPSGEGGAKHATAAPRLEKTEQVTRIRVVANQVLVPATVRNGGESVKVTLLLDTGSTRTALTEQCAAKLGIDLVRAKGSLVEVADGRVLHSKLAPVDQLTVGPRGVNSFELEFFPYNGSDQGFDGFLGMDFLARQRYQLDVENEVIRWF